MRVVLNRRELLGVFAASLLPGASAFAVQADELQFAGLDRVEFYVGNVDKSRDFFVNIFGNTLKNRNGKRYVKLGSSYMAFEPPRGNAGQVRVDHFSISIKHLEMPKLHEFLDRRAVMYQDYPSGRDTGITDSDGIRTQLSPENGWSFLNTPNFPAEAVATQSEPLFRPIALSQVSERSGESDCLLPAISRAACRRRLVPGGNRTCGAATNSTGRARRSSALRRFV